jgi:hypothetical protein
MWKWLSSYDLFVSYSRGDSARVRPLVELLQSRGYKVFFDLESIKVGDAWKHRLEAALRQSRLLVLCWSAQAKASEYVSFEHHKAEALGRRVLPWLLDATPLPVLFDVQGVTADDPAKVAAALGQRLGWSLTRRRWLLGSGAALAAAVGLAALERPEPKLEFVFRGHVQDERGPVASASVTAGDVTAVTAPDGTFALKFASDPGSTIKLTVSRQGYLVRHIDDADSLVPDFGITLERDK